ncbi:MAG: hypothetical protein JST54_27890 [Deltaproteobacteria bacterium]|nr:hypothetical protein [Deltaproteobacteria bacterium]
MVVLSGGGTNNNRLLGRSNARKCMPHGGIAIVLFLGPLAPLVVGCVTVHETSTTHDTSVRTERSLEPIEGTAHLRVGATASGTTAAFSATKLQRCNETAIPVVHRTEMVKRDTKGSLFVAPLLGTILVGTGLYSYFDADGLASTPDAQGNTGDPNDYRGLGLAMVGAGAVAFAIAAVDLYRTRDSEFDRGEVQLEPDITERECPAQPVSGNAKLILGAAGIPLVFDDRGHASVSLENLGVADLPSASPWKVNLEGSEAAVSWKEEELASLVAALRANPSSRLAREETAQAAAAKAERGHRLTALTAAFSKQLADGDFPNARRSLTELADLGVAVDADRKRVDDAEADARQASCQKAARASKPLLHSSKADAVESGLSALRTSCRFDGNPLQPLQNADGEEAAKLDDALQERAATLRAQEKLRTWRTFAAKCQRTERDLTALDGVRNCNATCTRARTKIEADWQALQEADIPDLPERTPEAIQAVDLCERSHCPNCPVGPMEENHASE